MVRFYLAVPVLMLVLFSVLPIFADTGSITIVSGKAFTIDYNSTGVKITDAQADESLGEILLTVQVLQNDGTLEITLPRELIDSKNSDGTDTDFLVVVDGVLAKPQESQTATSRTLQFTHLTTDEKEIDVIGTYLASSGTVTPTPQTPLPPSSQPTQNNQTSQTLPNQIQNNSSSSQPPVPSPTMQTNVTEEKFSIQQNLGNLVSKIPSLSFLTRLNTTDYAVIGSIVLVIAIVIASAARRSHRLVHKR